MDPTGRVKQNVTVQWMRVPGYSARDRKGELMHFVVCLCKRTVFSWSAPVSLNSPRGRRPHCWWPWSSSGCICTACSSRAKPPRWKERNPACRAQNEKKKKTSQPPAANTKDFKLCFSQGKGNNEKCLCTLAFPERVLLDIKRRKKTVIMKEVDCERGFCFFHSFLSFIPPVLCEKRLQVLWGNWLHNQTFPNFEHFQARSGTATGSSSGSNSGCRDISLSWLLKKPRQFYIVSLFW